MSAPLSWLLAVAAGLVVLLNYLAYRHAWAMTHFAPAGTRPPKPEDLTRLQKAKALVLGVLIPRPTSPETPASVGLAFERCHLPGRRGRLEGWHVPHPAG